MGTADVRFDAVFTEADNIAYTVETYTMDLNGEYGAAVSETKYGKTGATATETPAAKEGFTVADSSVLTGKIAADGSLVLKVYYSRNQYSLSFDGEATNVYYGAAIVAPTPTKDNYTFAGWDAEVPATMPAKDLAFTSQWTENEADWTRYNAAVAAAAEKTGLADYAARYTEDSRNALAAALAINVEGFKATKQAEIDAAAKAIEDATAGLALMTYNAVFYVDGKVYRTVPTKVDEAIAAPEDPSKTGYTFTGWNPEVGTMGTADVRFDAQFTENNGAVVLVTAAPENYELALHNYDVKVLGQAQKIQIVYASGATTTFDRRFSMINNASKTGILAIKSYDADGNLVDASSADVAYEIWTINVKLAEGTYNMRAKIKESGRFFYTWENGSYTFTVKYDEKPTEPVTVITVTPDSDTIKRNGYVTFTVVASKDVRKVKFATSPTSTVTRELKNGVDNGDGTYTYTISFKLSTATVYNYTVTYLLYGERAYRDYGDIAITVTE